jgi:hypothetical protein
MNIEINKFSFSDILRYVFPSFVLFACFYFQDSWLTIYRFKQIGIFGIIVFVFVGSLLYLLYRAFFYNYIIMNLQDWFRSKSDNYRTYFKTRYSNCHLTTLEAQDLWILVKPRFFSEQYSQTMIEGASGVHLLYCSSIIVMFFGICNIFVHWKLGMVFFGIFIVVFLITFFFDKNYETIEYGFLCSLNEVKKEQLEIHIDQTLDIWKRRRIYNKKTCIRCVKKLYHKIRVLNFVGLKKVRISLEFYK